MSDKTKFRVLVCVACLCCTLTYLWGKEESRGSSEERGESGMVYAVDDVTIRKPGEDPVTVRPYRVLTAEVGETGMVPPKPPGPVWTISLHKGKTVIAYTEVK